MKDKLYSIPFQIKSESENIPLFQGQVARLIAKTKKNKKKYWPLISEQILNDLSLAVNEGVANAVRHAQELEKRGKIDCRLLLSFKEIQIEIKDHGKGFDMNKIPLPDFSGLKDSGRGLFMMHQLVDKVEYKRSKQGNTLVLKREVIGNDPETRALDLLYEVSDAFLKTSDLQVLYDIILDKALDVFHVERASILLLNRELGKLTVVASRGLTPSLRNAIQVKPGEGISGYVFQHAKPFLVQDMRKNKGGWEEKNQYKSRSFISAPMICSPMRVGQESIGVINLTDRIDGKHFNRKDLRLLTTLANQATAYIHMVQLLSRAKEAELLQKELHIGRQIQKSYLPAVPPRASHLQLSGWCEMAQTIGGDYYDFIEKDPENIYIAIADVSGHNIAAALTMANFRSQLRMLLVKEKDPGTILTLLNEGLFNDLAKNDQFISMILVHFQPKEYRLQVANAGHRYPLSVRKGEVSIAQFLEGGAVLGAIPQEKYTTCSVRVSPGYGLLLYTDGLTEMANLNGKRFGLENLVPWIKKNSLQKPDELMAALKLKMKKFIEGTSLSDDVTAVMVQIQ